MTVESLADELCDAITNLRKDQQYWLGIVGPPGSGKSTLSGELSQRIGDEAIIIPMDGYHFYRSQLDAMPDASEAHRRRGAPFTFDAERFRDDLKRARRTGSGWFPSFEHGIGDPVERNIRLDASRHRLVIVEGNYLLLDDEPWCDLAELFDRTWFVQVDDEVIRRRLRQRFVAGGISRAAAIERVEANDMRNTQLIRQQCLPKADRVIPGQ